MPRDPYRQLASRSKLLIKPATPRARPTYPGRWLTPFAAHSAWPPSRLPRSRPDPAPGITRSTAPCAESFRMPVGSPRSSRTIRPPADRVVSVLVTPAMRNAIVFGQRHVPVQPVDENRMVSALFVDQLACRKRRRGPVFVVPVPALDPAPLRNLRRNTPVIRSRNSAWLRASRSCTRVRFAPPV